MELSNNNQNATVNQNEQNLEQQDVNSTATQEGQNVEQPKDSELLKANASMQIELRKQKKIIDDYSSQISSLKKQLSEKIASESSLTTQQTEEIAIMRDELEKEKKKNAFRDSVDSYLALGMDKDYATKVAQMKMEGEEEAVNTLLKGFLESERKRVKEETTAELYAHMPEPASGNGNGQIDYNKLYQEKLAAGDLQGAITAQLMGAQQNAQ